MTFFYKFWKKARVYYTLSISRGGGQAPPPGFATVLTSFVDPILTIKKSMLICRPNTQCSNVMYEQIVKTTFLTIVIKMSQYDF